MTADESVVCSSFSSPSIGGNLLKGEVFGNLMEEVIFDLSLGKG